MQNCNTDNDELAQLSPEQCLEAVTHVLLNH